jgi:hypothetical protein
MDGDATLTERPHRTHMVMRATISSERLPTEEILVRNISASGIGARARGTPPHIGEHVIIVFEAMGHYPATVRWANGNRFGVELAHAIDPAVFHFSSDWHTAPLPRSEAFTVADRFKPMARTWRPGVRTSGKS